MKLIKGKKISAPAPLEESSEVTPEDEARFAAITSVELSPEQQQRITAPPQTFPRQKSVLAVHWHPEFVEMDLIRQRVEHLYPRAIEKLIIPTQHNRITAYDEYCGVEVDCYSRGFQRKVQLLLHFHRDRLEKTGVLQGALEHTFQYRASQLFDLLATLTKPDPERLNRAARETGAEDSTIEFVRTQAAKLETLLERHYDTLPPDVIKNRLARNFLDTLRGGYDNKTINRAQVFLRQVKQDVKAAFPLNFFYRTSEIIEEARGIGAGIVIPHPEEFWPVLLADYDVDGYEVWNPQSLEYTDFLITVLAGKNRRREQKERPLLAFMGDDTHFSEKIKAYEDQDKSKRDREIGLQPPWDDLSLRKKLIVTKMDRETVIQEYKSRLDS
ncbi:MAG TPA: hypothetical protein ENN98_00665 [Desulfurivibrio alkaliphilus]|uniref:Uncharacterized protein n=1 Tax=Desulfurivibrio alkaliphilus TaxID=427923 RepID=A0A7C2TJQ7_9BACT|nr:hypothetical protein [Desulfurivibrio alkaliphilus]